MKDNHRLEKRVRLVRIDRTVPEAVTIITYQEGVNQFVTYKNDKPVGWCSTQYLALSVHHMYVGLSRVHS
jgi:hypothetical protein